MRNILSKFLFLFYSYYNKGSIKSIAYDSAIIALIMVISINLFSILTLSGVDLAFAKNITIWKKYLIGFMIFIPLFFLLKVIFKKEEILSVDMDKPAMRKGYVIIITYIVSSILLLIWVVKMKR